MLCERNELLQRRWDDQAGASMTLLFVISDLPLSTRRDSGGADSAPSGACTICAAPPKPKEMIATDYAFIRLAMHCFTGSAHAKCERMLPQGKKKIQWW